MGSDTARREHRRLMLTVMLTACRRLRQLDVLDAQQLAGGRPLTAGQEAKVADKPQSHGTTHDRAARAEIFCHHHECRSALACVASTTSAAVVDASGDGEGGADQSAEVTPGTVCTVGLNSVAEAPRAEASGRAVGSNEIVAALGAEVGRGAADSLDSSEGVNTMAVESAWLESELKTAVAAPMAGVAPGAAMAQKRGVAAGVGVDAGGNLLGSVGSYVTPGRGVGANSCLSSHCRG
jgi:hypothetical protein